MLTQACAVLVLTICLARAQIDSTGTLKLAKRYIGSDFTSGFDFYIKADPTGSFVQYVSQSKAQSEGLVDVASDGSFIIRVDAENTATSAGRNSVRITSKDKFADGVYILDLNHMPVGCGTWPAFWTTTTDGWPAGGEIDILEGANALPQLNSAAYNATVGLTSPKLDTLPDTRATASLHTSPGCSVGSSYMTGQQGFTTCDASLNANAGCGVDFGNNTFGVGGSFGAGVNAGDGGWYAMWRDLEGTGGIYFYFWPRGYADVPLDVKDPNTQSTNVANWGIPAANLTIPQCKKNFNNHVIVFNIALCGDYTAATYAATGCPSSCTTFTQANPAAFQEAFWSLRSLRVYTADGKPAQDGAKLSAGAIAGIVVGVVAGFAIIGALFWRWRSRRHVRLSDVSGSGTPLVTPPQSFSDVAAAPSKQFLNGETPTLVYGRRPSAVATAPRAAPVVRSAGWAG